MFNVVKKPYGIYEPQIISRHKKYETAAKQRDKVDKEHKQELSAFGWNTDDGTIFYVEED